MLRMSHHDLSSLADFMESVLEFLPAKDRKAYEKAVAEARAGSIKRERMMDLAKNLGVVTWPMRRTLDRFLETVGSELEWERVLEHVRPTTALLLKRLRKNAEASNLTDTLKSPDAAYTISPEQEIEIGMVRAEARLDLWTEHSSNLQDMLTETAADLEAMKKRLKLLHEQALSTKGVEQGNLLDRLASYEDRIFFGGEAIALEILDAELKYDAEEIGLASGA